MSYFDPYRRCSLYLVRHAETRFNKENVFRGWSDPPLDEDAAEQLQAISNYFSYEALGPVVSSDFQRCLATAEAVVPYSQVSQWVSPDTNLRTLNIGSFSGKPKSAENTAKLRKYFENPDLVIPGGESLNQFKNRWSDTLFNYLANSDSARPTVLVCQGCNISVADCIFKGEDGEYFDPYDDITVDTGGIVAIYENSDSTYELVPRLGEVLPEEDDN